MKHTTNKNPEWIRPELSDSFLVDDALIKRASNSVNKFFLLCFIIVVTLVHQAFAGVPSSGLTYQWNNSGTAISSALFSQFTGNYVSIAGGTVLGLPSNDDDIFGPIPIGFNFDFDGATYSDIYVSANGFIRFGNAPVNSTACLASADPALIQLVSALNTNLQGSATGDLQYLESGGVFTIQWSNYRFLGSSVDNYNFQIKLFSGTNRIQIVYGNFAKDGTSRNVQVGIKGPGTTPNIQLKLRLVANNGAWSASTAGVSPSGVATLSNLISVVPGGTAQQLAQNLLGPGVTISNATLTCPSNAYGIFSNGNTTNIGVTNGIILTTGNATNVIGPNNSPGGNFTNNNAPGDVDLTALAGIQTYDACKLEFDITPTCDTIKFDYVFASEEYPEFVGNAGNYNDVFAFLIKLSGGPGAAQNIALIPGTNSPITINNLNATSNSQFYVNNTQNTIQYDAFTTKLTAFSPVTPLSTYHLKIAIGDASDQIYDSGVLLQAGSLSCVATAVLNDHAIEACQNAEVQFCRSNSSLDEVINLTLGGTAVNGVDFQTLNSTFTIPAGQLCQVLPIVPIQDPSIQGDRTLTITYQQPGQASSTVNITISDGVIVSVNPATSTICYGSSINLEATGAATYSWTPSTDLDIDAGPSVVSTAQGTIEYTVTGTLNGCTSTATSTVNVLIVDDGNPCTNDVCDPATGVTHSLVDVEDFNRCTVDACDPSTGAITHTHIDIDDLNFCTVDACDPVTGLVTHDNIPVDDGNPCTVDDCDPLTGTISNIDHSPVATATLQAPIQCYGGFTTIEVNASGGFSPYSGIGNITVSEGSYDFPVVDDHGCQVMSNTVIVGQPTKIDITTTSTPTSCVGNDGTATASANGGTPGYNYTWNPGGINSNPANGLTTGTYVVTVSDANGCTNTSSVDVQTTGVVPVSPNPISGAALVCKKNCYTYSVPAVPGATSYQWWIPSKGASGVSSTNSIVICYNTKFKGGSICVRAVNQCGPGPYTCLDIIAAPGKPVKPGKISGEIIVCTGASSQTYCIAPVPFTSNYNWTINGNSNPPLTIASGNGTTCVVVNVPAGYQGTQELVVVASNCKGNGPNNKIKIKTTTIPPAQPGPISGYSSVCKSDYNKHFDVPTVTNATIYNWTLTGGATISSGQGTKSIKVDFRTTVSSPVIISVYAGNGCGNSPVTSKTVSVALNCRTGNNDMQDIAESNVHKLSVYPNPTSANVTVEFTTHQGSKCSLKVIDLIGRTLKEQELTGFEGVNKNEMNLEGIAKGMYFVSLQVDNETQVVQLIID